VIAVDSSAIVAIVNREPEREIFLHAIAQSDGCFISAVSLFETRMVARGRLGAGALLELSALLREIAPEIVPFDEVQADLAIVAFERFGKGINSQARLNMGDCASYALARSFELPLLFKGDDF
jgi:ribonuclease VapC